FRSTLANFLSALRAVAFHAEGVAGNQPGVRERSEPPRVYHQRKPHPRGVRGAPIHACRAFPQIQNPQLDRSALQGGAYATAVAGFIAPLAKLQRGTAAPKGEPDRAKPQERAAGVAHTDSFPPSKTRAQSKTNTHVDATERGLKPRLHPFTSSLGLSRSRCFFRLLFPSSRAANRPFGRRATRSEFRASAPIAALVEASHSNYRASRA